MKITIELPNNILQDEEINRLSFLKESVRDVVERKLADLIANEFGKTITFKDLGITKSELKEKVLSQLADQMVRERLDE